MKKLLLCFLLMLIVPPSWGAIGVDFASGWAAGSYAANDTHSLTIAANGNRLLLVGITKDYNGHANAVKWGGSSGTALTMLDSQRLDVSGGTGYVEFWYLKNPASGTANLWCDFSNTTGEYASIGAFSLYNVDQATTFRTAVKASVTSGTSTGLTTGTITCTSTDLLCDVMGITYDPKDPDVAAGQTRRWHVEAVAGYTQLYGGGSTKPGTNGTTVGWTWASAYAHAAILVVPVIEAASAKGLTTRGVGD